MTTQTDDTQMTERRHLSLRDVAIMVTLLLNFGALVWGAAKMSSTVGTLEQTTVKLDGTLGQLTGNLTRIQIDYNTRMAVLENRVSANERAIVDLTTQLRGR